jgi:cobalamin biosynthesis protein CobT
VDQATLENNGDPQLLDRHLREVIAGIEREGRIQLAAIGIKHEVQHYYRNAIELSRIEDLGKSVIALIDGLVVRD